MTVYNDTPDNQRATAAPQKLLANPSGATASVTVALPPNTVSLTVIAGGGTTAPTVQVIGSTTGASYPVGNVTALAASGGTYAVALVNPVVDSSVEVVLSAAPGSEWYIIAESVQRYQFGTTSAQSPKASGPLVRANSQGIGGPSTGYSITVIAGDPSDIIYIFILMQYGSSMSVSASGMGFSEPATVNIASAFTLAIVRGTAPIVGGNVISIATSVSSCAVGVAIGNLNGVTGNVSSGTATLGVGASQLTALSIPASAVGIGFWSVLTNGAPIYMAAIPYCDESAFTFSMPQVDNPGVSEGAAAYAQIMLNDSSAEQSLSFGCQQCVSSNGNPITFGTVQMYEEAA